MSLLMAAEAPQALRTASASIFLIREGEVVEESLYVAASVVRMSGTIEGDLVVLARDHLEVSGRVEGDILGVAGTVSITGVVTGSVRLLGVDLDIAGEVGRDMVGVGRDVYLGGSIGADSLIWSRSLIAGGEVGHDMGGRTFGRTIIGGTVGRDVEMTVGRMVVLDAARIVEDLGYRSAREATVEPGAIIGGTTVRRLPLAPDFRFRAAALMYGVVAFLLLVAYGLLRIWYAPEQLERSVANLSSRPLRCLGIGLVRLALLALPVAVPIAGVVWGAPRMAAWSVLAGLAAIPVLLLGFLLLIMTAPLPVLVFLGRIASRNRLSVYGAFVLPLVPLELLILLFPTVGAGVGLLVLAMGAGARARRGRNLWRFMVAGG